MDGVPGCALLPFERLGRAIGELPDDNFVLSLEKNESCQAYVTEKYQNLTVTNDRNEPKASGCGRGTQMVPVDHWGTIEE